MDTTQIELHAMKRGVPLDKDGESFYYRCALFTVFVGPWFLVLKKRESRWEYFTTVCSGISCSEVYLALSSILDQAQMPDVELMNAKRELCDALSTFAQQAGVSEHQLAHPHISHPAVHAERLN